MFNGIVNKGSTAIDLVEVLSGTWNEYISGEWSVTKCPFFLVLEATLDAGTHPLPFRFDRPVAGTLVTPGGSVLGVIVRPGEDAVEIKEPGLVTFQVFGDRAKPTAVR